MSNTPHTLHDEFPAEAQKISALKVKDTHFAKLLVDYDQVNDKVHRAETRLDLLSEAEEEDRARWSPARRVPWRRQGRYAPRPRRTWRYA
jgi:uncharacterized protein YdcH (DUF465 family)